MDKLCHSAVLSMYGVFGSRNFSIAEGEDSIMALVLCEPNFSVEETTSQYRLEKNQNSIDL